MSCLIVCSGFGSDWEEAGEIQSKIRPSHYTEVLTQMIKNTFFSPCTYLPSVCISVGILQGLLCAPNTEQATNVGKATAENSQHPEVSLRESLPVDTIQQTAGREV